MTVESYRKRQLKEGLSYTKEIERFVEEHNELEKLRKENKKLKKKYRIIFYCIKSVIKKGEDK